jgi:hypothetical protein
MVVKRLVLHGTADKESCPIFDTFARVHNITNEYSCCYAYSMSRLSFIVFNLVSESSTTIWIFNLIPFACHFSMKTNPELPIPAF